MQKFCTDFIESRTKKTRENVSYFIEFETSNFFMVVPPSKLCYRRLLIYGQNAFIVVFVAHKVCVMLSRDIRCVFFSSQKDEKVKTKKNLSRNHH